MKRGFSILEVLAAAVILGVLGLAVMTTIRGSARELRVTSEHTLSLFLLQKVSDEMNAGINENPFLDLDLQAASGERLPIKDGGSAHFQALEDTAPPWGRIEPGRDLAISAGEDTLFRLYGDYKLTRIAFPGTLAATAPGTAPGILDTTIVFDWPGVHPGTLDAKVKMELALPRIPAQPSPALDMDPGERDEKVERALFGSDGGLAGAASAAGVDTESARVLGTLLIALDRARQELSPTGAPTATAPDTGDPADPLLAAARAEERKASLAWQALLAVRDPAQSLAASPVPLKPPLDAYKVQFLIRRASIFKQEIEYHLALAIRGYVQAAGTLAGGPRRYRALITERKVLELAKLAMLITPARDGGFANAWIKYMEDRYRGRNPAMESYLTRQKAMVGSSAALSAGMPVAVDRLQQATDAQTALVTLETALK